MQPAAHSSPSHLLRITIVMLFVGALTLYLGYQFLREWSALQPALAVVAGIWALSGLVAFAAGCRLLLRRNSPTLPLGIGGAATILSGATLLAGVLARVVPCAGPTCVWSRLVSAAGLVLIGVVASWAAGIQNRGPGERHGSARMERGSIRED